MEDVTDSVFRRVIIEIGQTCLPAGRPDVSFTEFTNVDAIISGSDAPLQRLFYTGSERPIVAQIWGVEPEKFYRAAKIIAGLGFDGVDINFGCPVKEVIKIGACSAMIGKSAQVAEIIAATKEGVGKLPVSVKTRIGFKGIVTEEWIGFLLEQNLVAAIIIHGRTAAEMSNVPAHWGEIRKAVCLRNQSKSKTLIVGNGDIKSLDQAREMVGKYGVDGVMIGRGVLENINVFSTRDEVLSAKERLNLLRMHLELWEETWGEQKNFASFKKYIKVYVRDFEGAGETRARLMQAGGPKEMLKLI